MKQKVITIKKLEVEYPQFKLQQVTLDVFKGVNVLIGPNGSGKTTIIKSILGGINNIGPEAEINIANDIKIAYIPEKNYFEKNLKVKSFLKKWFNFYHPQKKFHITNITQKYSELNITKFANIKMENLSSGQLRQVLIIKSLLNNPNLIIMDEPFINLDPDNIINFFLIVKKLLKNDISVLMATHMLAEIEKYVNYINIIFFGKLIHRSQYHFAKDGPLYPVYQKYTNSYRQEKEQDA